MGRYQTVRHRKAKERSHYHHVRSYITSMQDGQNRSSDDSTPRSNRHINLFVDTRSSTRAGTRQLHCHLMGDLEKEDNMDRGQILLCTTMKGESVLVISTGCSAFLQPSREGRGPSHISLGIIF